ncbi:Elongator complex protein 4 [Colletotrichum chlorophyti]|uniref:Elongator complex protein 4 n=1 Tax=Colletotrichum chlorophyti TaxID=708187 RepID=A0A1Q8S7Y2_9PEZI|nr:Elongator complex protein 4 [Colletotrichum chlorophyti]
MSFRKKNVVLGSTARNPARDSIIVPRQETVPLAGVRPSPLDGRLTTSTGTASLDQLLAGHAGLPLGCSLVIQESGTTDFSGVLLRYYAAEGLVQGHQVHVLGPTEAWRGELPGLCVSNNSSRGQPKSASAEKMKIAWRYESLGSKASSGKRLQSSDIKGVLHTTASLTAMTWLQSSVPAPSSPLDTFISNVSMRLRTSAPGTIHRILVPSLLSPALYGSSVCRPSDALQFLHKLRALLRQHNGNVTAVISLSTSLYPRSTGFTRWIELLSDGVLEMLPLQRKVHAQPNTKSEDVVQGMLKVHSLPIYHERGGGLQGKSSRENLSFRLSSSSGLVFKPYSLPPMLESDGGKEETGNNTSELDF